MLRAFIALKISVEISAAVAEAQARLKRGPVAVKVSWSKVENLHLTLQFLGAVQEQLIPELSRALAEVASRNDAFEIPVHGVGAFPDERRPRVMWVGCEDRTGKLRALARGVQEQMAKFGFAPEHRQFAAHLTLGRVKFPRPDAALTQALDSIKNDAFGTLPVRAIHLFQSRLHPAGSIYTELSTHALKGETSHAAKN